MHVYLIWKICLLICWKLGQWTSHKKVKDPWVESKADKIGNQETFSHQNFQKEAMLISLATFNSIQNKWISFILGHKWMGVSIDRWPIERPTVDCPTMSIKPLGWLTDSAVHCSHRSEKWDQKLLQKLSSQVAIRQLMCSWFQEHLCQIKTYMRWGGPRNGLRR